MTATVQIMAILNVTPDSFSDGGRYTTVAAALAQARRLAAEGADIIDVGGESTRPGAAPVTVKEELARVIPVVQAIVADLGVKVSVDTSTPEVMAAAMDAGAAIINDVRALERPGALAVAAATGAAVVLMHRQGEPQTMQEHPQYTDVVAEVGAYLKDRVAAALAAGIAPSRLILDPGFGFGKSVADNYALLGHFGDLRRDLAPYPLMVALSRKSMLGAVSGIAEPRARDGVSVTAALLAVLQGARYVRTHAVAPLRESLDVLAATLEGGGEQLAGALAAR